MNNVTYIDEADITNKRVFLRADFDVSLNPDFTIADETRISHNIPTIKYLLANHNKLICVAKLNRPKNRDPKHSLKVVVERLRELLPENKVTLVDDFLTAGKEIFNNQTNKEILVLENIRFYPEEKKNDPMFARKLADLADVYVNDSFAMAHRNEASVVGVTQYLPSYGGLLLKKEIEMITKSINNPQKPVVAIIGGAKISTKINVLGQLIKKADYLLIGGGLANTFLCAQGSPIGESFCEREALDNANFIYKQATENNTQLILPWDVVVGNKIDSSNAVYKISDIPHNAAIYDIGPETQARFGAIIAKAKTIIWNGPVGYVENPAFRRGTDFIYYAITQNSEAVSIVGGGDTLAAISKKEYLNKITHISTGGGAMLEFIEKGTLPGIEALRKY